MGGFDFDAWEVETAIPHWLKERTIAQIDTALAVARPDRSADEAALCDKLLDHRLALQSAKARLS